MNRLFLAACSTDICYRRLFHSIFKTLRRPLQKSPAKAACSGQRGHWLRQAPAPWENDGRGFYKRESDRDAGAKLHSDPRCSDVGSSFASGVPAVQDAGPASGASGPRSRNSWSVSQGLGDECREVVILFYFCTCSKFSAVLFVSTPFITKPGNCLQH